MDNKHVIASSLLDNELAKAFSELVAERWDNWDLSPFLVYLVDTCASAALPYLAEQFDIDGLRGFEMATNEQQQRDLIKRSIALHKFIGTPWAIREACRSVGFPVIVLEEGASIFKPKNGAYSSAYSRAYYSMKDGKPTADDWACFRVLVEADMARHITADEARKIRLFVEFYKNERSHLVELGFFQSLSDTVFRTAVDDRDVLSIKMNWKNAYSRAYSRAYNQYSSGDKYVRLDKHDVFVEPSGDAVQINIQSNTDWRIE